MIFYTTKEQEIVLDFNYKIQIENKQKEINQKQLETGKIQKYTAYAFVKKEPRVFYKIDGMYYIEINNSKYPYQYNPLSLNHDDKPDLKHMGQVYKVDSDLKKELNKFLNDNEDWIITFYLDKKNGSVIYCSADKNDTPADIYSLDRKNKLILEIEDKYDLCIG